MVWWKERGGGEGKKSQEDGEGQLVKQVSISRRQGWEGRTVALVEPVLAMQCSSLGGAWRRLLRELDSAWLLCAWSKDIVFSLWRMAALPAFVSGSLRRVWAASASDRSGLFQQCCKLVTVAGFYGANNVVSVSRIIWHASCGLYRYCHHLSECVLYFGVRKYGRH